ncbi:hypothetical protein P148_SR1C00001G0086 [candidate division SR1 bacterium RAAC1_SR1_1]|nr:hypothetical protein P148_SR1C00001G0086 [candidate division SR1 bacterium RAAC1_SR1_1]
MIKTLAIETSCDDTSIGIISFDGDHFSVDQLLAYSQVPDHQKYGGVMPEIASRLHSEKILGVLHAVGWGEIENVDTISVTTHPGLPGSLVVGKAVGATLAKRYNKPLYEVNHIYGHIFSLLLERNKTDIEFPMVVLTASGGHNDLYFITEDQNKFHIEHLGKTLDDAAGECFDKVSRMLGGPYPGGVWIGEMAQKHKTKLLEYVECNKCDILDNAVSFKRIFLAKESFDFSFSGMKSQVSILLKNFEQQNIALTEDLICEIAYEFQESVVEVLAKKLARAGLKYGAKTLGISGGVSANDRLWEYANGLIKHKNYINLNFSLVKPTKKIYSTDNAAMIGVVGILQQEHML